jgi:hypothetical protein
VSNPVRLLGIALIAAGLLIFFLGGLWLAAQTAEQGGRSSTLVFGLGLIAIVLTLPCLVGGGLLLRRGQAQERELLEVEREKRLLTAVLTRGQVPISDLAIEVNLTRQQVQAYLYDLVGKGLFTGYVDWKRGILYAREAAQMPQDTCPNCGGRREIVGKGVVRCLYCGAELFL